MSPAYAQDYKDDLLKLSQSIRQTEKQKIEIENRLEELFNNYNTISDIADAQYYDSVVSLHNYHSLNQTSTKHAYLLRDQSFIDRSFRLKHQQTIADISKQNLNTNIQKLTDIDEKSKTINHYLNKRKRLEATLSAALKQVEDIQQSRKNNEVSFQSLVEDLKKEDQSLNDFLQTILNSENIDIPRDTPLIFSMPVSGIIKVTEGRLMIEAAPSSLVITPARGKIIYADHFGSLGLIIMIHHGDGYISVLRGLASSYVNVGFDVIAGEPIGILQGDKNAKDLNQAMLIYELRYNNKITNPLLKMTGL